MSNPTVILDLDTFVPDSVIRAGGKEWAVEYMSTRQFRDTLSQFKDLKDKEEKDSLDDEDIERMELIINKSVPTLPADLLAKFTAKQLMAAVDALLAIQSAVDLEDKKNSPLPDAVAKVVKEMVAEQTDAR